MENFLQKAWHFKWVAFLIFLLFTIYTLLSGTLVLLYYKIMSKEKE